MKKTLKREFYRLRDGRIVFVGPGLHQPGTNPEWFTYYARPGKNPKRLTSPKLLVKPTYEEARRDLLSAVERGTFLRDGVFAGVEQVPDELVREQFPQVWERVERMDAQQ